MSGSIRELDDSLTRNPKGAQTYYWRAQVFARQGEPRKGIADLETATALQPGFAPAYSELARLYSTIGQRTKSALALAAQKKIEQSTNTDDRSRLRNDLVNPLL